MPQSQPSQRRVVCQGLFGLGLPEIVVIAGVTALIFGPSKLPELGKGLGKTIKSFQSAAKEFETELKAATSDEDAAGEKKAEVKEGVKEGVKKE
jgi:sec-independent protein translocase protein TatA